MFPLWGDSGLSRALSHGCLFSPLGALGGGGVRENLGLGCCLVSHKHLWTHLALRMRT